MRATAKAQPNIALIKYWGKRELARNHPAVGSISVTLDALWTEMGVEFDAALEADSLTLNGRPEEELLPRISRCLDTVAGKDRQRARVDSRANFPVAAGLASSASSFAALTVAAAAAAGIDGDRLALARLAGRASGSAARSLYAGFVELDAGGRDIEVDSLLQPDEWPLSVVVAVTDTGPKALGSTEAMERSRRTSPFYARWIEEQPDDLRVAREAIAARDFEALASIAEHNCLKMHSVMWTSRPPVVYWNSVTIACMEAVREMRQAGSAVFFTIDAGPQLKAVCLPEAVDSVRTRIAAIPGVSSLLTSRLGDGASLIGTT